MRGGLSVGFCDNPPVEAGSIIPAPRRIKWACCAELGVGVHHQHHPCLCLPLPSLHHLLPNSMSPPSSPRTSLSQTAALTTSFCHGPSSPLPCGCNFRQPPQRLPFQDPPLPVGHFKTKEEKEDHHGDDTFHPTVQPTTYLWLHLQTAMPVATWPGPPLTSPQSPPSLPRHPRSQEFNHRRRHWPAFPPLLCH